MDEHSSDDPQRDDDLAPATDSPASPIAGESPSARAPEEPQAPPHSEWRPADYYAAPRRTSKFPRWVPLTCGVVAIIAIGMMAITGAFLQAGGLAKLVAIAFGQMNAEAERMFDAGVAPDAKASFRKSLLAVRDGIADGTIELQSALPLLQKMQKATSDKSLSADEVDDLTGTFEESLDRPAGAGPAEPPTVDL